MWTYMYAYANVRVAKCTLKCYVQQRVGGFSIGTCVNENFSTETYRMYSNKVCYRDLLRKNCVIIIVLPLQLYVFVLFSV